VNSSILLRRGCRVITAFTATALILPAVSLAQNQVDEVTRLIAAADGGDAKAQLALGRKYSTGGAGVVQNDASALWWFRKAAEQGVPEAEFEVGAAYSLGRGVEQDDAEAYKWFVKCAQHGFAQAQTKVGLALAFGTGVEEDDVKAYQWFRRAAEQGNAEGQFWVGGGFETGAAGRIDPVQALEWWRASAEQGYPPAQIAVAHKYGAPMATARDPMEAYKWLVICATLASEVQTQCAEGRDRMDIYFGSDRLADARQRAREWLIAFERRQQQKK
jgi:TPR repeat protein